MKYIQSASTGTVVAIVGSSGNVAVPVSKITRVHKSDRGELPRHAFITVDTVDNSTSVFFEKVPDSHVEAKRLHDKVDRIFDEICSYL